MSASAIPDNLIKVADAAARLGVSHRTVLNYIDAGTLLGFRVGPRMLKVRAADVEALVQPAAVENSDAEFVRDVVAAAGKLTAEARAEIRRLLPPVSESAVDGAA
ncbi:helix-turn-helix domain-containing protein [Amycolatopsis sp. NBC_00438]|uniref:helix-turn-helix domain-containing protein n=1 Tax=Amycolatopsis sp. NBC_00438 TaxID=2903558 RepID=UPI002E2352D2